MRATRRRRPTATTISPGADIAPARLRIGHPRRTLTARAGVRARRRARGGFATATRCGKRSQNVVRFPGSLSTPHSPPWLSMIDRTMARPSPVPDPVTTRFMPALTVTSGMRFAPSSDTAAFERSISARATRASGASASCSASTANGATAGKASRSPTATRASVRTLPVAAFSFSRAIATRLRAVATSICTAAAATCALVTSTGETFPARACRPARSAERAASAADSSVT